VVTHKIKNRWIHRFIMLKAKPPLMTGCFSLPLHIMTINAELYHSHARAPVHLRSYNGNSWAFLKYWAKITSGYPHHMDPVHILVCQYLRGLLSGAIRKNMKYYSSHERPRYFRTEIATRLLRASIHGVSGLSVT
jgi:hypothetical protein